MKSSPTIWHLLHTVKPTMKILSNFVVSLENINFIVQYAKKNLEKKSFKVNTTFAVYIYM